MNESCMHACMHACMHLRMYVCIGVCMYQCVHVCMYVCMYTHAHMHIFIVCTYAYILFTEPRKTAPPVDMWKPSPYSSRPA